MTGRGYLVLGATGGIGSAVCSLLVARGAGVLASGRDPRKLAQLIHCLREFAAMFGDNFPRRRVKLTRASIIAETFP